MGVEYLIIYWMPVWLQTIHGLHPLGRTVYDPIRSRRIGHRHDGKDTFFRVFPGSRRAMFGFPIFMIHSEVQARYSRPPGSTLPEI